MPTSLWLWKQEWLLLAVSLVVVAALVAIQWRSFVLGGRDYRILGLLPVPRRTVMIGQARRACSSWCSCSTSPSTLFPGCGCRSRRPSATSAPPWPSRSALLMQTVFACGAIVALQGLVSARPAERGRAARVRGPAGRDPARGRPSLRGRGLHLAARLRHARQRAPRELDLCPSSGSVRSTCSFSAWNPWRWRRRPGSRSWPRFWPWPRRFPAACSASATPEPGRKANATEAGSSLRGSPRSSHDGRPDPWPGPCRRSWERRSSGARARGLSRAASSSSAWPSP